MAIRLKIARTQNEIDDATWVRHEVFVVEDGKFGGRPLPGGRMTDHFDSYPGVYNLVGYDDSEPIATIRLTEDTSTGLPAEQYFDFKPYRKEVWNGYLQGCLEDAGKQHPKEPVFGSASMLSVRGPWRRRRDVIRAMYRISAGISQSTETTQIIAIVRHSTANMYRRLGFRPLVEQFWNEEIGEYVTPLAGEASSFYGWAFGDNIETPLSGFKDRFGRLFLRAGETIFSEGDEANEAYIVESGDVRITRRRDDSAEITLSHLLPGELFGEFALVDDEPRSTSAVAITDAELITLSRDAFQREVQDKPEQLRTLLEISNDRLRQMEELFSTLAFSPDSKRLEHALKLARIRTIPDPSHPEHRMFAGGPAELAVSAAVDEEAARRFLDLAKKQGTLTYSHQQIRFLR